ncbi:hypothetical protein ACIQBJ_30995 [Kitasatospora sp. NPDC088391]|uniref:hypothetical protein n=1 Tax=Kitasatospora sp. NPDC088391 TaxID=3364074 RepID=UPI00381974CC
MSERLTNRLELRVGERPDRGRPEIRFLVDGRDLLATGFGEHSFDSLLGPYPISLLGPYSPLLPGTGPREVRLQVLGCSEDCCGALYVTVRREGGTVHWDGWRNPVTPAPELPAYRFDAGPYLAEVERAGEGVEHWPARSVARLLEVELGRRAGALADRRYGIDFISTLPSEPDLVTVVFHHRPDGQYVDGRPCEVQLQVGLAVPEGDPAVLAAGFADRFTVGDPTLGAEICGGTWNYAERIGQTWPLPG